MSRPKPLKALKVAHDQYKKLNVDRAHRLLDVDGIQKKVGALYAGLTGILGMATLFGSVIAAVLSVATFASLTMTPVGWAVVSGGFLVAVVGVGISQYYKFLSNLAELKEQRKDYLRLDGEVLALGKKIERAYENLDYAKEQLRDMNINDELVTAQKDTFVDARATVAHTDPSNAIENQETNSNFIWRLFSRAKNIFYKGTVVPLAYLARKLHLPQFVDYLAGQFPVIAKFISDIHAAVQPHINKVLEFIGIYGTVVAAISGILSGVAGALGVSIAKMGLVSALTSVLAAIGIVVSGPVALGIILAVGAVVSASLFINKVFYNDPLALLLSDYKADLLVLPTTLDHNNLILAAVEAQVGKCKSRIEAEEARIKEKAALLEVEKLQADKQALEQALAAAQSKKDEKPAVKGLSFMPSWWSIFSFSKGNQQPQDAPTTPVTPTTFGQSFSDSDDDVTKVASVRPVSLSMVRGKS